MELFLQLMAGWSLLGLLALWAASQVRWFGAQSDAHLRSSPGPVSGAWRLPVRSLLVAAAAALALLASTEVALAPDAAPVRALAPPPMASVSPSLPADASAPVSVRPARRRPARRMVPASRPRVVRTARAVFAVPSRKRPTALLRRPAAAPPATPAAPVAVAVAAAPPAPPVDSAPAPAPAAAPGTEKRRRGRAAGPPAAKPHGNGNGNGKK